MHLKLMALKLERGNQPLEVARNPPDAAVLPVGYGFGDIG